MEEVAAAAGNAQCALYLPAVEDESALRSSYAGPALASVVQSPAVCHARQPASLRQTGRPGWPRRPRAWTLSSCRWIHSTEDVFGAANWAAAIERYSVLLPKPNIYTENFGLLTLHCFLEDSSLLNLNANTPYHTLGPKAWKSKVTGNLTWLQWAFICLGNLRLHWHHP